MSYINALKRNNDVLVWERVDGKRKLVTYPAPYYFYAPSNQGEYTSIFGDKLERHDFTNGRDFNEGRAQFSAFGARLFESDIPAELKILSERYYNAELPVLNVTFFDIEVDYDIERGFSSLEDPYAPINSIALYHNWQNRMVVLAVPPPEYNGPMDQASIIAAMEARESLPTDCDIQIKLYQNEKQLLEEFLKEIEDSDVLSGWNSDGYDIPMLGKRLEKLGAAYFNKLSFMEANRPRWKEEEIYNRKVITLELSGRVSLDYMLIFKKYEVTERPSYSLEAISDEILIDDDTKEPILRKLEYDGSLGDLYHKDFIYFLRYNIRDTEVLKGFEERLGYVELSNIFVHQSTGLFKQVTGTIKLSEMSTLNYCHYDLDHLIVPDTHPPDQIEKAKGAFVLLPQTGEHKNIGSIDINSLYPSTIRSNNISPETIIGQFDDNERAFEEIRKQSYVQLTLSFDTGEKMTATAEEWREALLAKKWGISGYGTVFTLEKEGIVPAILRQWYDTRKKYQREMLEAKESGDKTKALYFKKLQHVYKIKLNSFYGSLLNPYFKFYDKRMGESTTATSRLILLHQCAKVNELLDGKYILPDREIVSDGKGKEIGYTDKWSVVYGDSVAKDTSIILEDNTTCNIEDLFKTVHEKRPGGKEYYFPENIKALTYDEKINGSTFENIRYVMRHKVSKKMFRVWLTNLTYVDVTEDHSLIGYKNTQKRLKGESCLTEVKPEEIGGDIKSLIFLKHIPRTKIVNQKFSKEIYEFLGYIVGDGYCEKRRESGVGLSIGADDIPEITEKLINPLIEQGYITSFHVKSNEHDIRICGTKIYDLVKKTLYYNGIKEFPSWIFDETIENISSFLRGYYSADGTVNGSIVSLSSINLDFIKQTQKLLFYCGISSNYFQETCENHYDGVPSGTYTKKLSIKNTNDFKELIGFIQDRKNEKIPTNGKEREYLSKYDFAIARGGIKVEEIEYDDYVYDIEIDNTHTFFANNILVHNTDSSYFVTHAQNEEEAILVADAVGEQVSASFPEFMREAFLCQPGFDDIIKTGREIVADNGIFVKKKKYMLHVVNSDGFPTDDLKVMGLDTKKTFLPKHISKKINDLMTLYLTGTPWDEVATQIVDFKEELKNTDDIMSLGLTKGVKNVEKYTLQHKNNEPGMIPGHVAASIFYNECLEKYGDLDSPKINSGMKIKTFQLKHPIGRFKAIAMPVDLHKVPNWFREHIAIDYDEQILRLVDKPLENTIQAIGKKSPTKQSLYVEDVLEF